MRRFRGLRPAAEISGLARLEGALAVCPRFNVPTRTYLSVVEEGDGQGHSPVVGEAVERQLQSP